MQMSIPGREDRVEKSTSILWVQRTEKRESWADHETGVVGVGVKGRVFVEL